MRQAAQKGLSLLSGTSCLSERAKAYGTPLPHHPDLLLYNMGEDTSGWRIVHYECLRYRTIHQLLRDEDESLHSASMYAMELHPEYFGSYPAPVITPRGYLIRYEPIMSGVFAIETDRCEKMVAVCYPVWSGEFSEYVLQFAEQTDYDLRQGIHTSMGYVFFSLETSCLALFELGIGHREIRDSHMIDGRALMNAVWRRYPDYAVQHNMQEQSGQNNGLELLLRWMGVNLEMPTAERNLLRITEGAGTDFLKF